MVAGPRGDHGNSVLEHVEAGWSSPIENARTPYHRMVGNTVRAKGSSTDPATHTPVRTTMVRHIGLRAPVYGGLLRRACDWHPLWGAHSACCPIQNFIIIRGIRPSIHKL